ncbi:MAG: hypothetical protein M1436_04910 [Acidobacteria bacterium]|nr:hypothetical protein [Acidobacteriota bacterium]
MVTELVEQARRRYWWNEILAQGAWALSAAMAALVILLLLGTQVLDWRWLVLLPAGTLALGIYRTVRHLPSRYQVAQIVDARLRLADALSTAVYFDTPGTRTPEELRALQRAQAERLCDGISIRHAVPFTMPRGVYALSALLLVASSLFALRYALERRLDLQRPMARILQHALGLEEQQQAKAEEKKQSRKQHSPLDEAATLSLPAADQQMAGQPQTTDAALDASAEMANSKQKSGQQPQSLKVTSDDQADGDEAEGEATDEAGMSTGSDKNSEGQQGPSMQNLAGQKGKSGTPPGSAGNNSSLLSKFKDAMQNLLSRMKPQPAGASGGQPQMARNQNSRQNSQQAGNKSQGQQGGQKSGQEGESQDGQSGQEGQTAQNAQGRGNGDNGEQQSSNQPGSGIGKQDGNKDPKLAEQLAAMGKLSEIIGKRSANVSGEVTVEVQSSTQQLQTPYSQRNAAHGEAGTEISRDEVPAALQAYVQQYFEQVRKQAPPSHAKN